MTKYLIRQKRYFALTAAAALVVVVCALAPTGSTQAPTYTSYLDVEYANVNSTPVRLDLFVPNSGGPFPVVIWVHGGGWQAGDKGDPNPAMREVERGYAVVSINYRLQILHPAPLDPNLVFPLQIKDCKAAVRWLRANAATYNLDPNRIGAWGESAGGHLSALLGTSAGVSDLEDLSEGNASFSSRVQAVVDWYGPTDFLKMDAQTPPACPSLCHDCADSPESYLIGCAIQSCPTLTERANPITYVTPDDAPFLIMHGTFDCEVPSGQSQLLYDALQGAGLNPTLEYVEGAGHGGPEFADPALLSRIDAFLDRTLGGGTGPASTTAFLRNDIGTPGSPYAIAIADFNNDGKRDLTVSIAADPPRAAQVAVFLGVGNGTFGSPTLYRVEGDPQSIAVGDVNGDGRIDIVSAGNESNDVSVLLGNGDGTFQAQQIYPVGVLTHYVILAHFNGDSKPDIATAADDDEVVSILLNNGNGTFGAATNIPLSPGCLAHALTSGDFNGDGKQDLAVACLGLNHIEILLGNGDGTFNSGATVAVGSQPHHVIAADVNNDNKLDLIDADSANASTTVLLGDGAGGFTQSSQPTVGSNPLHVRGGFFNADNKLDLVTANSLSNDVSLLQGNGNGTFAPASQIPVGSSPSTLAIGDLNGDNLPDIAVANSGDGTISILLNSPPPPPDTFTRQDFSGPGTPYAVAIADFNSDGKRDLAITNLPGNNASAKVAVYSGNGDGTFGAPSLNRVEGNPLSLAVADLNGDNKIDIVSAGNDSQNVSVLLGNGDGTFQDQQIYPTGVLTRYVILVDLNNDNKPDIVTAGDFNDVISILLNNGDGTFGTATNIPVAPGGRSHSVASGDFNGDGKQDLAVELHGLNEISILLGNGDGTFTGGVTLNTGSGPNHVIAADVNNDNKLDLIDADSGNASVTVFLGDGLGGFTQSAQPIVGTTPMFVGSGLLNGDSRLDLVAVNTDSANISYLQGNGDGTFATSVQIGVGPTPTTLAVGDLNGDNKPDVAVVNSGDNTISILLNSFPAPTASISGNLNYQDSATGARNVTMTLTGTGGFVTRTTTTDINGDYTFTNVPVGNDYTVTPSRATEVSDPSITAFDASRAARFDAMLLSLTPNQQIAGDSSNNGSCTAFDASQIARYELSIPSPGSIAGSWKFTPASLSFTNLSANQTNQNLTAILVGDISGNWTPSGPIGLGQATPSGSTAITVSLPSKQDPPGGPSIIPVAVGDTTGQGIGSYAFDVSFNQAVLVPQAPPFDATGTLSSGWTITPNTSTPGHLIINAFSTSDLTGQGVLLNLKFTVVGGAGSTSPLTWVSFTFNEGTPSDTDINGSFTVAGPSAAPATIRGLITNSNGSPLGGVTVQLSGGSATTTITDGSGNYHFDDLDAGQFYTVTPSRANYVFAPPSRSFSLLGVNTEASFTANANGDDRANAIDTIEFFVRQHYLDFLGREPDPPGFIGWVNTLRNCAAGDASCDRVHVSESFYRAQEFQERGYFAYRFYSTALGRKPDYAEFVPDLARVSGFLTNDQLEAAKTAFLDDFMMRPAFAAQYNRLSNSAYVDALLNTGGVNLSNRQAMIDSLNRGTATRAQVLRQIAESSEVYQKNYNQAFVVMEYFGYLHRDPDSLYLDWIRALDANPADSRRMVDGFVNSAEYRNRFAQ